MKPKRFFHIIAIVFSSLASIISHGQAKQEAEKKSKKGDSEVSKPHRHHGSGSTSHEASQDPPLKLDPALMAGAVRIMPVHISSITPPPESPEDAASRYPWKRQIVTTTFWIGENATANNPVPNQSSSWDPHWSKNYGGTDDPDPARRTAEYLPANFTPGQNPFYIALPYNDVEKGHNKPEAARMIPWFDKEFKESGKSVCHGRWIAIRFGNRVCYAQWEDCGPFRTDHAEYVFGNERPKPNLNRGAGLDVSPAVRDFLGMNGTDVTDWKFVDFDEVPQGPWARYGENNTFVQNARKGTARLAQISPEQAQPSHSSRPVALRD